MADEHAQNRDPFAEAFPALYQEGRLIDVPLLQSVDPAHSNAATREAKRAEIVKNRVAPVPAAAAPAPAPAPKVRPSLSADVDAILAEEGIFQPHDDEWDEAA